MRLLLIHQNFPGQFRQLAPHLEQRGHELVAIASHKRQIALKGLVLRYEEPEGLKGVSLGTQIWHEGLGRASLVAHLCKKLDEDGWRPDLILAHSGWGETLGLKEVWPTVPQILWPELWVVRAWWLWSRPDEAVSSLESRLEQLGRNALTRTAMSADAVGLPTHQGRKSAEFYDQQLHVIHEGLTRVWPAPIKVSTGCVVFLLIARFPPSHL